MLYKNCEAKMYSRLHQNYLDTWATYKSKALKMNLEYQQETIKTTGEYMRYDKLKEEVSPYEEAINDRQYEPLVSVLAMHVN